MRVRVHIMEQNYPERALERTIWLYHRILKKRTLKLSQLQVKIRFNTTGKALQTITEFIRIKLDR